MLSWRNAPRDSAMRGFCPFSCPLNIPCLSVLPQSDDSNKDFWGSPRSLRAVTIGCWLPEFAGSWRLNRGLKRCTDCRFIQKHSPGNKGSTDQMCRQPAVNSRSLSILKDIGYCLGPVQEEFLAKGCAVGAGLDTESLCSAQGARPSHHASSDSNHVNTQLCIGKGGRESSPSRDYLTSCACTQSRSSQTSPAPSS